MKHRNEPLDNIPEGVIGPALTALRFLRSSGSGCGHFQVAKFRDGLGCLQLCGYVDGIYDVRDGELIAWLPGCEPPDPVTGELPDGDDAGEVAP